MAGRWDDFYKYKVEFPYVRQEGVKGKVVRFEIGEESEFLKYLRTDKASYLWSDSEDLQVMCNLYQMQIKVITIKSDTDEHPSVNFVGPDQTLDAFKLLPAGNVPEMTLLHYSQQHYNLIVSKDSDLVIQGTLSQQLKDHERVSSNKDDTEIDIEEASKENENNLKEKYESLEKEYRKGQKLIKSLREKIVSLEQKVGSKKKKSDVDLPNVSAEEEDHGLNVEEILSNKGSGYSRESPQFDSKSKKSQLDFRCTQCDIVFGSQHLLNSHINEHHNDGCHKCSDCNIAFKQKSILDVHIIKKHRVADGQEFNCKDCSFQGNNEKELKKHLSITHHKSGSQNENSTDPNYLTCHSCGKKCACRVDPMKHRKHEHSDIIKRWKFCRKGICAYEDHICWFSHNDSVTVGNAQHRAEFKCRFCEKIFQDKSEFMLHRKTDHYQIVSKCRDHLQGKCTNSDFECWYKHDDLSFAYETQNEEQNLDFQEGPEDHPPDMMKRMMDLMEMLMMKVNNLEKSSPIQQ